MVPGIGTEDTYYIVDYYINFRFSDNEMSGFFSWWNNEKVSLLEVFTHYFSPWLTL